MPTPVKKIPTPDDPVLSRVQDAFLPSLNALLSIPILDGRLLKDLVISTASFVDVKHGLDRVPVGWFIVAPQTGSGTLGQSATASPDPTRLLRLVATGSTVRCSLWVF